MLDLKGGAVGELTSKTLGIAHGLLAFLVVLGLVVELLRGPGQRKHYLAIVWRTVLVLALLQAYTFLAGSVVKQCTALAQSLASWDADGAALERYQAAVAHSFVAPAATSRAGPAPAATAAPAAPQDGSTPSGIGGFLFEAAVQLVFFLAEAIVWVFTELSRILIGFFYAIGPLALVFYVPGLDTPGRWLRSLITVSCWPVVSSVLLHLSGSVLTVTTLGNGAEAAFRGLASALLLCVLAFATPKITSALVGGVGNLLGEGAATAASVASGAATVGFLR